MRSIIQSPVRIITYSCEVVQKALRSQTHAVSRNHLAENFSPGEEKCKAASLGSKIYYGPGNSRKFTHVDNSN